MRDYFFGANWKMNMPLKQGKDFLTQWVNIPILNNATIVFFPTQYTLGYFQSQFAHKIHFGAQNVTHYPKGAFTGETTAQLLKEDDINYTLIGHSERREYFKEQNEDIYLKLKNNLEYKLKTILCVGEPLTERQAENHIEYVKNQLQKALEGIKLESSKDLVIAYEPIWAIGTGITASSEDIEKMHQMIRGEIKSYGLPADNISIIYGGSVNSENAKEILALPNVDGALIGGASLKVETLEQIIHSTI